MYDTGKSVGLGYRDVARLLGVSVNYVVAAVRPEFKVQQNQRYMVRYHVHYAERVSKNNRANYEHKQQLRDIADQTRRLEFMAELTALGYTFDWRKVLYNENSRKVKGRVNSRRYWGLQDNPRKARLLIPTERNNPDDQPPCQP